jgi:hypothetical protein
MIDPNQSTQTTCLVSSEIEGFNYISQTGVQSLPTRSRMLYINYETAGLNGHQYLDPLTQDVS